MGSSTNSPTDSSPATQGVAANASGVGSGKSGPTVNWRIFQLPSVLAVIFGKFCCNMTSYSFTQWAPTVFADALGCSPMQTAQFLAWPAVPAVVADFAVGGVESWLLRLATVLGTRAPRNCF
jgi:hypothetical protein